MAVVARPLHPDLPPDLQWRWGVFVADNHVGTGTQSECEALAAELSADPRKTNAVLRTLRCLCCGDRACADCTPDEPDCPPWAECEAAREDEDDGDE